MDIFSHAVWGATLVRKRPLVWWALLFGAGPDILGSGPGALYLLVVKGVFWGTNTWQLMPDFFRQNYAFWHSILGIAAIAIFLLIAGRRYLMLLLPFSFHVLLDLFTHETDILSRLFHPFTPYLPERVVGANWWESSWMLWVSTALLIGINLLVLLKSKNKKIPA